MRALVALAMSPGPAFVEQLQRTWDDGDAALPMDPRLPPAAVGRVLTQLGADVVVGERGERHRLASGQPVEPGDALVIATSGTTGQPKGVVHTHASLAASAQATNAALEVDPERDRWLCCLPVAHTGGLGVVVRALSAGTPVEVHERFDAAAVEEAAARRGATLTSVVPTVLGRFDSSGYRRILVGGMAVTGALPPNAVTTYGLTETAGGVVYDGLPIEGAEVRVVDGEVQVRGPMVARGYRNGTELSWVADPDGGPPWLATGDAGSWEPAPGGRKADGRPVLRVVGRRDDLIVTGGVNVWPGPVEAVLARCPGVAEVAVVGRPDPEWGALVTAVVVPADRSRPPTLDELRAAVKEHLHPASAPRSIELARALPRTSLGKLRRSAL